MQIHLKFINIWSHFLLFFLLKIYFMLVNADAFSDISADVCWYCCFFMCCKILYLHSFSSDTSANSLCAEDKGVLLMPGFVGLESCGLLWVHVIMEERKGKGEKGKANMLQNIPPYFRSVFPSTILRRVSCLSWTKMTSPVQVKIW